MAAKKTWAQQEQARTFPKQSLGSEYRLPQPPMGSDWRWVYELAGLLGWPLEQVLKLSLPELFLVVEGAVKARGGVMQKPPLSRQRLDALMDAFPDP